LEPVAGSVVISGVDAVMYCTK